MSKLLRLAEKCLRERDIDTVRDPDSLKSVSLAEAMYDNREAVFREAISRSDFPLVLGATLGKRLIKEYKLDIPSWEAWVSINADVPDLKEQKPTRIYGGDDLAYVPELGEYPYTAPSEEQATYYVKKYGRKFAVSIEALINDDLGALKKFPKKLAPLARRTLSKFVYQTMLTANPTIYDGNPLFDAANHGNLGNLALDATNLAATMALMKRQQGPDNEDIEVEAKFLLHPPELNVTARQLCGKDYEPTVHTAEYRQFFSQLTPIETKYITDNDEWILIADPNLIEGLEIGFLSGKRYPEVLQHVDNAGMPFDIDALLCKVRHWWGGCWNDFRGVYRQTPP
jgi:hypothetical protein